MSTQPEEGSSPESQSPDEANPDLHGTAAEVDEAMSDSDSDTDEAGPTPGGG